MKKVFIIFWLLTSITFAGLDAKSGKVTNVATPTVGTDGANKQYVDDSTAAAGHNILSVAHGDTTNTGIPTRGSMMIANSTPKWSETVIGAAGTIWRSDGTEPSWSATTLITTLGTITTGTWQATDIGVEYGGTGVSTLTDGGILLGSGTGAITALSVATNGQIPIGDGATDPVLATITGNVGIDVTNGAGTITLDFDSTEIDATTWSDGANASNIWTFDVSGTDTTVTYGNDIITYGNQHKIDVSSATALLVEDSGTMDNVFVVDTVNGTVGIGTTPSATRGLNAVFSRSVTANFDTGFFGQFLDSSTNDLDLRALNFLNNLTMEGTGIEVWGLDIDNIIQSSDGTYDNIYGIRAKGNINANIGASLTVDNWYQTYITNIDGATFATFNTLYGLYIEDIGGGGNPATTNWAIFSAGGDWILNADNQRLLFGAASAGDASISYDGANFVFDPAVAVAGSIHRKSGLIVETDRLTGTTTLDTTHYEVFCDTDGGAFTVTLPAAPVDGRTYRISNVGSSGNALTLDENGIALLGSVTTLDLLDGDVLIITHETVEGWY